MDHERILRHFSLVPTVPPRPFGDGHINDTFRVTCAEGEYVLQRLNTDVFPHPEQVMENIVRVTDFLRKKLAQRGEDPARGTLEFLTARDGTVWFWDESGFWRVSRMITGTCSRYHAANAPEFELCGEAFGQFQRDLADFDASLLHETIPNFHHTPKRYEALTDAARLDPLGRAGEVGDLLKFAEEQQELVHAVQDAFESGRIPLRVTHNDTKLNNVLLDQTTGRPVCVVDLDTVMPGFSVYDFGDAIRSGAATAAEDEKDFTLARIDTDFFEAFSRGFLHGCGEGLTAEEIRLLPVGAMGITLECGMRFLTDYLLGDTYFHCSRPGQNLDRCRVQFHLVQDMLEQEKKLCACIKKMI